MKRLDPKVIKYMATCKRGHRNFICEQEFMYFIAYYFPEFLTYELARFHYEGFEELKQLLNTEIKHLVWIWFRESAKTTIAKIFITYCICHSLRHYILFDSFTKTNAEQALYDVANWLQTNKKIIKDYGQLFYEAQQQEKSSKKKSITEFITANGVKVEAITTQESVRGRVYNKYRPDLIVADDIETEITKASFPITYKIQKHFGEMRSGMAPNGIILTLGNYIYDAGTIQALMDASKVDPTIKIHRVDVVENGKIMWPDKYVHSDIEAKARNFLITDPTKKKISLEEKKRTLNAEGRPVYEQEMLNQPIVAGEKYFDPDLVRPLFKDIREPEDKIGGWKYWGKYFPSHRYGMGADTALGIGKDSNAAVIIDFSTNPRARVVGTYQNNQIDPAMFAYELKNGGNRYGECVIAPEINNTGYATLTKLRDIYNNIYERERTLENIDQTKLPTRYGWETNMKTKPDLLAELRMGIHDNLLEIPDKNLLEEVLRYGNNDLLELGVKEGMTRHFDLVMALAIAWKMRSHATARRMTDRELVTMRQEVRSFDRYDIV